MQTQLTPREAQIERIAELYRELDRPVESRASRLLRAGLTSLAIASAYALYAPLNRVLPAQLNFFAHAALTVGAVILIAQLWPTGGPMMKLDPHLREMLSQASDEELAALETELRERLAFREDRRVLSESREDKIVTFAMFAIGLAASICVYQILQLCFLYLAAKDAEWNLYLLYLISGIAGLGAYVAISQSFEAKLRRGLLKAVRHRDYFIYAAMFALSVSSAQSDKRATADALAKSKLPWSGPSWAILSIENQGGSLEAALYSRDTAEGECVKAGWQLGSRTEILNHLDDLKPHLERHKVWVSDTAIDPSYAAFMSLKPARVHAGKDQGELFPLTSTPRSTHEKFAAVCTLTSK